MHSSHIAAAESDSRNTEEDTPLLHVQNDTSHPSASPPPAPEQESSGLVLTTLCLILLFSIELGAALMVVPTNLVLETSICQRLHGAEEADTFPLICKEPDVQGRLAEVRGWASSLAVLPSLLCAIPYGISADKYGRQPIIVLSTVGIATAIAYQVVVGLS